MAYASKKARNIKPSDTDKISEKPDTTIEREGGTVDVVDVGNAEELISVIGFASRIETNGDCRNSQP